MSQPERPKTLELPIAQNYPKIITPDADYDVVGANRNDQPYSLTNKQLPEVHSIAYRPPEPFPVLVPGSYGMPGLLPSVGMNQPMPSVQAPPTATAHSHLEQLAPVNQISIHRQVEVLTDFPQFTSKYRCLVKNTTEVRPEGTNNLFYAVDSDLAVGNTNAVKVHLFDTNRNEVIRMARFEVKGVYNFAVTTPTGMSLGYLYKERHCCVNDINIADNASRKQMYIESSLDSSACEYRIFKYRDDEPIGVVSYLKYVESSGIFKDVDVIVASFPVTLDVNKKALIIAAAVNIAFLRLCE